MSQGLEAGKVVEDQYPRFVSLCHVKLFADTPATNIPAKSRLSLVACSNKFGYIFVLNAISKELVVFPSGNLNESVIQQAASTSSRRAAASGACEVDGSLLSCRRTVLDVFSFASQVTLSDDETVLMVTGQAADDGTACVAFFSISAIAQADNSKPYSRIRLSSDPSVVVTSLVPRPTTAAEGAKATAEDAEASILSAVALMSDGSLVHFAVPDRSGVVKVLGQLPGGNSDQSSTALSWSRRGKQFVAGSAKTGQLIRYEPAGMKVKGAPLAPPFPMCKVRDILWLDNNNFIGAYVNMQANSSLTLHTVLVNSKRDPPLCTDFGDVCYSEEIGADGFDRCQYYFAHIPEWRFIVVLSQMALEGAQLRYNGSNWEQVVIAQDEARLLLPSDPTCPGYPVGCALSFSLEHPRTATGAPSPVLLVPLITGSILTFAFEPYAAMGSDANVPLLAKPPQQLPAMIASAVSTAFPSPAPASPPKPAVQIAPAQVTSKFNISQPIQAPQAIQPTSLAGSSSKPQAAPFQLFQPASAAPVAHPQTVPPIAVQSFPQSAERAPAPVASAKPITQASTSATGKTVVDPELDEFVAEKLAEELSGLKALYAQWSSTVKPQVVNAVAENKAGILSPASSHLKQVISDIDQRLTHSLSFLDDLEGNWRLLADQLVELKLSAEQVRANSTGDVLSAKKTAVLSPITRLPGGASNFKATASSQKKAVEQVISQLNGTTTTQLATLRQLDNALEDAYDALVEEQRQCGRGKTLSTSELGRKTISESAFRLQKQIEKQRRVVADLCSKCDAMNLIPGGHTSAASITAVRMASPALPFASSSNNETLVSLARRLVACHRPRLIVVPSQPTLSELGKPLPHLVRKPPVLAQQPPTNKQTSHVVAAKAREVDAAVPSPVVAAPIAAKPVQSFGFTATAASSATATKAAPTLSTSCVGVNALDQLLNSTTEAASDIPIERKPASDIPRERKPAVDKGGTGPSLPEVSSSRPSTSTDSVFAALKPAAVSATTVEAVKPQLAIPSITLPAAAPTATPLTIRTKQPAASATIDSGNASSTSTTTSSVPPTFVIPVAEQVGQQSATAPTKPQPVVTTTSGSTVSLFGGVSTASTTATTAPASGFSNLFAPSTTTKPGEFSFGSAATTSTSTAPTAVTTTAPSVSAAPSLFGVPATTSKSTGFSFATTGAMTMATSAPTTSSFSFLSTSSTTAPPKAPVTTAAVQPTTTSGTLTFGGFGALGSNSATSFGAQTTSAPSFGALTTSPATSTATANVTQPAASGQQFGALFGGSSAKPAPPTTTTADPLFGGLFSGAMSDLGGKPKATGSTGPFGAGPVESSSSGMFGSISTPPAAPGPATNKPSMFSFAAATSPQPTSFGGATTTLFGQQAKPTLFGAPPASSTATPAPAFGTAPSFGATPSFGTTPAFGATPAFGGAPTFGSNTNVSPSSNSGGIFGSAQATQPTSFGMFGQQTAPQQQGTFGGGGGSSIFGGAGGASGAPGGSGFSSFAQLANAGTGLMGNGSASAPSFTQHRG